MTTKALSDSPRRSEDLLLGLLATMALRGVETLRTTDKSFHHRFGRALEVFKKSGGDPGDVASTFHRDIVSKTFDELDHALIAAEQLGWVKFPNPSYSRLQITMSYRDASKLLAEWKGYESSFQSAVQELLTAQG